MKSYKPPAVTTRAKCLIDGCDRLEELANGRSAGGLCAGHRYRKKRGLPLEPPLHEGLARRRGPKEALLEAALRLADVDGDDAEFGRAWRNFLWHVRRWGSRRREAPSKK